MTSRSNKEWYFGVVIIATDPPNEFVRTVQMVEALGFDYIWIADSSLHARDAYAYLTLCAQHTRTAKIGISVTNPFTRHPAVIANAIATIDEISGGRTILGVGTGDRPQQELGFRPARVKEMQEWITLVRQLFSGEPVTHSGDHWQLNNATLNCGWRREIPIQVAASGPRMLELTGSMADGGIVRVGMAPEAIDYAFRHLAIGAEKVGRTVEEMDIGFLVNCCLYRDRARALREARLDTAWYLQTAPKIAQIAGVPEDTIQSVQARYAGGHLNEAHAAASSVPDELAQRFVLAGTSEEATEFIRHIGERGVRRFEIFAIGPDWREIVRNFGEQVIPAFR